MFKNKTFIVKELMNKNLDYIKLLNFLEEVDKDFPIPLSKKVNLSQYAQKVLDEGIVLAALDNFEIIGVLTGYINDKKNKTGFISLLGVSKNRKSEGVGSELLQVMINYASYNGMEKIFLNTHIENKGAIFFYEKRGFIQEKQLDKKYESDTLMKYFLEGKKWIY